jgi:hypothetical protein
LLQFPYPNFQPGNVAASASLNVLKKALTNIRIDEQMGLMLPSDTFRGPNGATSVPMYEFKFETPSSGRTALDANTPIDRHKMDILTSCLCDFIQMGHSTRGAQNLAETKVDMFMQSVEGWLNSFASTLNHDGLGRLWDLNGFDRVTMPEYAPDMAQRLDLDVFSNMLLRLSQAGMPMFPDPDLEAYIRDTAGLPDAAENDAYEESVREAAGDQGNGDKTATKPGAKEAKTAKRLRMEKMIRATFGRALLTQRRPA